MYGSVRVSPDGGRLLFQSNRGELWWHSYIWMMNSDGTGLKQLTTESSGNPLWSPDGTRIAFEMLDGDNLAHVYVMNADGTGRTKVSGPAMQVGGTCGTTPTQSHIDLVAWLPDGRVFFTRYYCGVGTRYFVANADGTGFTETDNLMKAIYFSPDRSQVVFTRLEGGSMRVVLANADGSGARVLSTQGAHQGLPSTSGEHSPWSPDGKRIVFFAYTSAAVPGPLHTCGDTALPYVVNVDGSGLKRLVDSCAYGTFDGWSRSGEQVAFTLWATSPGVPDIHVVNADGTGSVNLTNGPLWEMNPTWLPRD
jgi:Tol biopolymer transport system component